MLEWYCSCASMIIARGWNFLFYAGNRLCDECGDRAVEYPYDQLYILGGGCDFQLLLCRLSTCLQGKIKGSNPIKIPALVYFGAWKGKERKNPRLKRKAMDRRPSSRLVIIFFLPHPSAKGTAWTVNHACGSDLGRSDILILTRYTYIRLIPLTRHAPWWAHM